MNKTKRTANLLPNGTPRYIRCYDNFGETLDRYTVIFTGNYTHQTGGAHWYIGMNGAPFHPQGIGMDGENARQIDIDNWGFPPKLGRKNHLGTRVEFSSLPDDCRALTLQRYKYLWDLE